jgi:hypothetical protein
LLSNSTQRIILQLAPLRGGVMDFRLGSAAVGVGPGADAGSTQPYFFYDFYTEVCRGQIEEGSGGAKACSGPRGDMLDTIQRRNYTVVGV